MAMTASDALETVNTLMTHVLCGRFDDAKRMFLGEVETLPLPTSGEHEKIVYTLGSAEEDGETIVVPTEIDLGSPEAPTGQTIRFVCVDTDEGPKIDMDATLQETLGASPDDLVAGLAGLAGEVEAEFEKIEDDEPAPELYSPEGLSDAFRAGMQRFARLFDDDLETIAGVLENEDLDCRIAWATMCDDDQCPQRLLGSVISPLRTALKMLEDHRCEDPAAERDASIRKVRASIEVIEIINSNDERISECTLKDGRLRLIPCLMTPMDNPATPTRGFTADEIEWMIRDTLDLDVGPAIKRTEAAVAEFADECRRRLDYSPTVTVDWESFRAIPGGEAALDALKRFRDELLEAVLYALFHLRKKAPLDERVGEIVFRNVMDEGDRGITADGGTITMCVPLVERRTCYSAEEVQELLAGLIEPPPAPQVEEPAPVEEAEEAEDDSVVTAPEAPAEEESGSEFRQMVASMESDMMGPMREQMSQLFGREFALEVDWDSMDEETDHFNLVVTGAMGAVMGALMVLAYDPATKGRVVDAVGGMALRYDQAVRGIALFLDGGVLHVSCGGPASEFSSDPTAMGEMVSGLLP